MERFGGALEVVWGGLEEVWGRFGEGLGSFGGALGEAWVAPPDNGFIIWNLKKLGLGNY